MAAAAAAVISQLTQALSFLREHPKLSCVLLLLLSSPMYRILLYFTPLLLSTALCIFALITLTPYVTATDAEVERQSLLGASSQKFKKKASPNAAPAFKERKLEEASGYGEPSSSASSSSAASSSSLPAASPSCPAAEASWLSWMKGLNEIGFTWMESKLTEQGLSLSEPANRETLLAFIEGSFADLLTTQEIPSIGIFDAEGGAAIAETEHGSQENHHGLKVTTHDGASEGYGSQESREREDVVCAKATSDGDGVAPIGNAAIEEVRVAEKELATVSSDVYAVLENCSHAVHEVKSMQGSSEPLFDDVKGRKLKSYVAHESALPIATDTVPDVPAAAIMPKTPSRIPAPSKLLEASRRIFSKEEQSRAMIPRAPLQASSAARVNQPLRSPYASTQSKTESAASVFKLPARKFLERSRSIPSKEGSKLSSATLETQAGRKVAHGETKESDAVYVGEAIEGACDVNKGAGSVDGMRNVDSGVADLLIDNVHNFGSAVGDDGPRFDEDLKVEEAQALVQSELKMLEVELDEVAAKLPKLDETFAYQKTPIKSTVSLPTSSGGSIKCSSTMFSASPTFKAA